jgi:hypothetical protein
MRTEDLINSLSRDAAPALPPVGAALMRSLLLALPVTALLFTWLFDIRMDALEALGEGWFALKLLLAAGAGFVGWRLTRASAAPGRMIPAILLAALIGAILLADVADLMMIGAEEWRERLVGDNAMTCLVSIPLLALAPLAASLWSLRDAAVTRPALAGAAAGLMAGGVAALFYGLHCTDDSPLFLSVWYVMAISLVAMAGAAAGRVALKW